MKQRPQGSIHIKHATYNIIQSGSVHIYRGTEGPLALFSIWVHNSLWKTKVVSGCDQMVILPGPGASPDCLLCVHLNGHTWQVALDQAELLKVQQGNPGVLSPREVASHPTDGHFPDRAIGGAKCQDTPNHAILGQSFLGYLITAFCS